MTLGEKLRSLRWEKGVSIKKLAPLVEVDHTYLSKLENDHLTPSPQVIDRLASYYEYDRDELLLLANRIPPDILEILRTRPQEALAFLRERFAGSANGAPE